MTLNRRKFLKIAGGGGVILAATGLGVGSFVATRTPTSALLPWQNLPTAYPDPLRRALAYAILAPNPHNRQPWLVELKSDTEAVLTCDLERLLPDTDPFNRQIVIGLGCFLELFAIAAQQDGYRAQIDLFPDGEAETQLDSRAVAHLRLVRDAGIAPDPLFAYVLERHTNRSAYDMSRAISSRDLEQINAASTAGVTINSVAEGPKLQGLRELSRTALRDEIMDPAAFGESVDLMRIGRSEIEANPDGISIGGAFLESLSILGMISREQLGDPNSSAFQVGLDMADEQALTAMGFVWINTLGNTRQQQIAAGRAYLRVALEVTGRGLAMQPMSQALQEYAAMQPHYQRAHAMLTESSAERIQMLARLGYASSVGPAPRWALSTRIKQS